MAILRKDGTAHVRLIAPGNGSSGHYPVDTLKRAAAQFTDRPMYWNHATAEEAARRPEGDLRNLAGKIIGTPVYEDHGKIGPGLYADVKVYEPFQKAVESMGTDIGVSIRAMGRAKPGMVEGQKVNVIEDITTALSADWVTAPGANGRAVELFEAARPNPAPVAEKPQGGSTMAEDWEPQALAEAQRAQAEELRELRESLARAREREQIRDAEDIVRRELGRAELHEMTRVRLASELVKSLPLTEAGTVDQDKLVDLVRESVQRESAYLTAITGSGRIRGMGSADQMGYPEDQVKAAQTRLEESFGRFPGMTTEAAKIAAAGRR